jgi:protein NirF
MCCSETHVRVRALTELALAALASMPLAAAPPLRGTGDLGIVIEREAGSVVLVETTGGTRLGRIEGLGDLSHASAVFSPDARYAFVFGRDGGLSKLDLLEARLVRRVVQAGNSIGGAISADGELIAVSNYEPGGVRVFDAATLEPIAELAADYGGAAERSRVVGLVDAPGRRFVFSLYEAGEIRVADFRDPMAPLVDRHPGIGRLPYDGMLLGNGRYYLAGLYGEDALALLDLWESRPAPRTVLAGYRRGAPPLPVYKMPHLEGCAVAGGYVFLPAVGEHAVLVADARTWREVARIPLGGQPVFAVARPDEREVWVNFALPQNDLVQVIDVARLEVSRELRPGRAILHLEFTPRAAAVWMSARDDDRVVIHDPATLERTGQIPVDSPSGIFFTARAHRIGM